MWTILIIAHVGVAFALVLIVLLQSGKGSAMGAAFGGSSQTVFGSRGPASFLHKLTTGAAVIFMLTSLTLSVLYSRPGKETVTEMIDFPQPVEETTTEFPLEPEPLPEMPEEPVTIPQSE